MLIRKRPCSETYFNTMGNLTSKGNANSLPRMGHDKWVLIRISRWVIGLTSVNGLDFLGLHNIRS